jgi:hypothetical protein
MFTHSSRTLALNDSDVAVAARFAGRDDVQAESFVRPVSHVVAGEFGGHCRSAAPPGSPEFGDEVLASDISLDKVAQTFAGVVKTCGWEPHRPSGGRRRRRRCCRTRW